MFYILYLGLKLEQLHFYALMHQTIFQLIILRSYAAVYGKKSIFICKVTILIDLYHIGSNNLIFAAINGRVQRHGS